MIGTRAQELYDQHIQGLPVAERLRLLALLASDLAAEAGRQQEPPEPDILALYGAGKGRGVGMDAQEYVRRLREGESVHPNDA
jgi:hypothetical protein